MTETPQAAAASLVNSEGHAFELREKQCPTCGISEQRVLGFRGGRLHRYGLGVTTRIVQCRTCRLVFPNPFPYPVQAQQLYADPAKYFEDKDEARRTTGYRQFVQRIAQQTGCAQPSILDVGSGRGELLRAAQLEGLRDVVGLEFSQAMIRYVSERYGIHVVPKTIEDYAASTDRTFDAVVLNAVIEHVYDPDAMIAACAKLTQRHAVLYIDTCNEPNLLTRLGNLYNRLRGSSAVYNLSPTWIPYHVFGFNRTALRCVLSKHGFEITSLRIHALPTIPSRSVFSDRLKAFAGAQVLRLANALGQASNMYVWARRV